MSAAVWQKIESIRLIVLDTVAELAQQEASFIFTNVLFEREPNDLRWYEEVEILAAKRKALLAPVNLVCEPEELCRRVTSPGASSAFQEKNVAIRNFMVKTRVKN